MRTILITFTVIFTLLVLAVTNCEQLITTFDEKVTEVGPLTYFNTDTVVVNNGWFSSKKEVLLFVSYTDTTAMLHQFLCTPTCEQWLTSTRNYK